MRSWKQFRVTPLGGRLPGWLNRFGSVTEALIWLNVAVFFVQLLCTAVRFDDFERLLALSATGIAHGFFWQPLTYMFLHGGIWHILVNLMVLWFFGREVEFFIGPRVFTRLYLFGGLAGAALWLAFNLHSLSPVIGASAAVLACVVAFATLFPEREVTLLVFFVLPVTLKARTLAWIAIAVDAVPLLSGTDTNIAHLAHLGGAALGYLYIKGLGYGAPPRWLLWSQRLGQLFRPRQQSPRRPQSVEDYIREEIDPILDKISRDGIHSLSRRERKILESARDLMQKHQR